MHRVLVASENREACDTIQTALLSQYQLDIVYDRKAFGPLLRKRKYKAIFVDLDFLNVNNKPKHEQDYKQILYSFWRLLPDAQIIVLSSQKKIKEAVKVVRAGANNHLSYPIKTEIQYVLEIPEEGTQRNRQKNSLYSDFWSRDWWEFVRTKSPRMKAVYDKIMAVAPTKTHVLLMGETGTGKGVIAKLIHEHSNRKDRQFIHVHCGAVPETLIETEFFGHEKGAFTGSTRRKLGKFELAQEGTIFLDEIGTITPLTQIKLLQVVQDNKFYRVGGEESVEVNVRIIAATNADLKKMMQDGIFRSDLYYRLSVFPIEIPPLRERPEDIALFVELFLQKLNQLYQKEIRNIHPDALKALREYSWPGNIRELENSIERAYILEDSSILTPKCVFRCLPKNPGSNGHDHPKATISIDTSVSLSAFRHRALEEIERQYLQELLALHRGKINNTAEAAGISTRQLSKLLGKYGLHKEYFKYFSTPAFSEC